MIRNKDVLLDIGFVDIGKWTLAGEFIVYELIDEKLSEIKALLDTPNALYAFIRGEDVVYIGKTTRSVKKRFAGYCRPGISQATNKRCHAKIKASLANSSEIRILVFTPINQLQYSGFEINLAAGLEDSLINDFEPSWNGKYHNRIVSETTEREDEMESAEPPATSHPIGERDNIQNPAPLADFSILLGATYYEKGIVNVGVGASQKLGDDGESILVEFNTGGDAILSKINRTANRSGGVRLVGNNSQIAKWFQSHFTEGDIVQGVVIDRNRVKLFAPQS